MTALPTEIHFFGAWETKIHHIDVHQILPWVVAIDERDFLVLWDYEHHLRLQEVDLTLIDEDRDEKEKQGGVIGVKFYDETVWDWRTRSIQRHKRTNETTSAGNNPLARGSNSSTSPSWRPGQRGMFTNWIILTMANKVVFLDCHSLRTKAITSAMLGHRSPTVVEFCFGNLRDLVFVGSESFPSFPPWLLLSFIFHFTLFSYFCFVYI
jgi:hypothetical protein